MLGPQARAAELKAVRSAAQRQKSREAEAMGPSESVSVSLTDFIRNPLQNRNRGPKLYKPLTRSDLTEASPTNQIESQITPESSQHETPPPFPSSDGPGPAVACSGSGVLQARGDSPSSALHITAPIAPRSMLQNAAAPAGSSKDKVAQPDSSISRSHSVLGNSGAAFSPRPLGGSQSEAIDYRRVPNFLFGLEAYSPAKAETKLNLRAKEFTPRSQNANQNMTHHSRFDPRDYLRSEMPSQMLMIHEDTLLERGISTNPLRDREYAPRHLDTSNLYAQSPYTQQAQYDQHQGQHSALASYGAYQTPLRYLSTPPRYSETRSLANRDHGYLPRRSQLDRSSTILYDLMRHQIRMDGQNSEQAKDTPYDHNTKMQHLAVAQEAMERTGKTVLHHPDVDRRPLLQVDTASHTSFPDPFMPDIFSGNSARLEDNFARENEHDVRHKAPGRGFRASVTKRQTASVRIEDCPAIMRAVRKREIDLSSTTSGLAEGSKPRSVQPASQIDIEPEPTADRTVVVDEDVRLWCKLRTVTGADRKKLQSTVQSIASESTSDDGPGTIHQRTAVIGIAARQWMHNATVEDQNKDQIVERMVADCNAHCTSNSSTVGSMRESDTAIGRTVHVSINVNMVRAVANVMAIVSMYAKDKRQFDRSGQETLATDSALQRLASERPPASSSLFG